MTSSATTKDGLQGARPDTEATVGVNVPPGGGGPRRRRRREEPEFRSYYDLPVLNDVVWSPIDIGGYLFLGGLAGASGAVAGAAALTGRPGLARAATYAAAGGAQVSLGLLIHDLGRPSRFLTMLRVVKLTSPMNVGAWLLGAFSATSTVAALSRATGRARPIGAIATAATAVLGPAVATYTGVLISDTAVPAWHDGHELMPFVFASSAVSSAAGVGLLAAPAIESGPVRALGAAGAVTEVALGRLMQRRMGIVEEAYRTGRAKWLMHAAEGLTLAGAALAATARSRPARLAAGASLVVGSALTRFGIFAAGVQSVRDPKYTVVPQRERRDAASGSH
ncbi:NrfD/PsrC family molybdoenzyme membrane anchor subunit [Nocardioides terrisoli]|uniref:NrfD/PsrC family molybdoenzyme membrane anchor subunit n=1 Tax=Nocardioides terrisoli TaxID=3388267 RepID=UPI00287B9202|nr:NrfD/PsrC family molybdoenzyme membrane anchor subunit [Nocardioides marmorisolisilvae]